MLFLGIEILSLSLYVLAGIRKRDLLSNEASLKYFLMGAFQRVPHIRHGIVYGATGSFSTDQIAAYMEIHKAAAEPFVVAGIILLMMACSSK
jgi:NADH-quinone oxidoreductase subunit N